MPSDKPLFHFSCPAEQYNDLIPVLRQDLEMAAWEYAQEFPQDPPWRITSGTRTLREQAKLMAAMTPEQLRNLYGRRGIPSYVEELIQAMPLTPQKAHHILAHRKEGYVSRHLYGKAVDVAADSILHEEAFLKVLQKHHLSCLDERSGNIPCFHICSILGSVIP